MSDVYRFASFPTFCGVPTVPIDELAGSGTDVVIIGAPIDWGATYAAVHDSDRRQSAKPTTSTLTCTGHISRPASTPSNSSRS